MREGTNVPPWIFKFSPENEDGRQCELNSYSDNNYASLLSPSCWFDNPSAPPACK